MCLNSIPCGLDVDILNPLIVYLGIILVLTFSSSEPNQALIHLSAVFFTCGYLVDNFWKHFKNPLPHKEQKEILRLWITFWKKSHVFPLTPKFSHAMLKQVVVKLYKTRMQLFLSNFQNKIDKKGRVSVPASFRAVLARQEEQAIIVFRSLQLSAIEGFSASRMEKLSQDLDTLDPFSQDYEDWTASIFADAHHLIFDSEGRIQIPEVFCAYAGITDVVTFVGRGRSFQLWNPDGFCEYQAAARERLKEKKHMLKGGV